MFNKTTLHIVVPVSGGILPYRRRTANFIEVNQRPLDKCKDVIFSVRANRDNASEYELFGAMVYGCMGTCFG